MVSMIHHKAVNIKFSDVYFTSLCVILFRITDIYFKYYNLTGKYIASDPL